MSEEPKVPPCSEPTGSFRNAGAAARLDPSEPQSSDRDERRLVAAAVRLLMRLPRVARYGLLALALAGGAEMTGGVDAVLGALLTPEPVAVRYERSDSEALELEMLHGR